LLHLAHGGGKRLCRHFAAHAPLEFGARFWRKRGEARFPGKPRRLSALTGRAPLAADRRRNLEGRRAPAEPLPRRGDFLGTEGTTVGPFGAGFRRR
jgi:hypothetical protein